MAGKLAVGERRLFWSLVVTGGVGITYRYPHGPPLVHQAGESTVWQALLTETELGELRKKMAQHGVSFEAYRQGRQEILERSEESEFTLESHKALEFSLDVNQTDPTQMVYPTEKCPLCFWFHPEGSTLCGLKDWPVSMLKAAETLPKAVLDKDQCPLHGEKDEF